MTSRYARTPPALFLMLSMAATAGATHALAQESQKPRLAVVDFRNSSSWSFWGPKLGQAAADELATQLVQTDEFTVVERSRLEALMAEQQLGQSGAVAAGTAAEIGRLLGVQAIVTGSITQFSIDRKGGGLGPLSASFSEAESVLDIRLVDTSTGEILLAAEGAGKKRFGGARFKDVNFQQTYDAGVAQEALRPAVENTVQEIVGLRSRLASIKPKAPPGEIVGASGEDFYINRGENFGVEAGDSFEVYRIVNEIRNSDGELLDRVTERVGVVRVTRVLSQSAICELVSGDAAEGDEVRPGESGGSGS